MGEPRRFHRSARNPAPAHLCPHERMDPPGPPPAASAPPLVSWGKLPEQAKKEKLKIHVSCVCIIPRKEEREIQKGERLSPLHSGLGGPGPPPQQ